MGIQMQRKRRRSYKFTEKTHSKKAMVSMGVSGASLLLYLIFTYLSYRCGGTLSAYYGSFGVLAMIMSVVALILTLPTLKEEDTFTFFPRIALALSVISTLCWVGTYISGFMRG